jgi:hypothetical protein
MRRAPLFVIAVALLIVAGVGVALAATHDTRPTITAPADAGAEAAAPTIEGDVTPSQQTATGTPEARPKAITTPKKHVASHQATVTDAAAATPHAALSGDEKDCWDDCGSSASGSASSAGIDDDHDGDGGDCGEGD